MPLINTTWGNTERSGGAPRELFSFYLGGTRAWRYANSSAAITVGGIVYDPAVITRDDIERSDDDESQRLVVRLPITLPLVTELKKTQYAIWQVVILRWHDTASGTKTAVFFNGTIASTTFENSAEVRLELVGREAAFKRSIPAGLIQRHCIWQTFSPECGVDPNATNTLGPIWKTTATVSSVDTKIHTITMTSTASPAAGFFTAGWIEMSDTIQQRLLINKHLSGFVLQLLGKIPTSLIVGTVVTLLPGDDKLLSTCRDRFLNVANFMGFNQLPQSNPLLRLN